MALSTYAELKAAIATQIARSDLTTPIVDFVTLVEADIRRDVRIQEMESLATGSLTGETLAFPTRFVLARRLAIAGKVYTYETPQVYRVESDAGSTVRIFTTIGTNLYILGGASGTAYSLLYLASFAAFSGSTDTNALLANAPDVYLYGACKHASIYLKDDADAAKYAGAYQAAVSQVNGRDAQKKASGSALAVRAV